MRRPFDMTSSVASSFARTSGLRWGRMMIPVPRRIRLVCAARKVSATMGSTMRSPGPSGEGGAWGSGSTTCSPPQSDSKPAASAARATRAAPSGYEQGPVVIENRPNLRGIAISSRPTLQHEGAGLAKAVAMGAMRLAAYLSVLTAMSMAPVSYVVAGAQDRGRRGGAARHAGLAGAPVAEPAPRRRCDLLRAGGDRGQALTTARA